MRTRTTYVYIYLGEVTAPAGRLQLIEDGRNSHSIFQYGERYLRRTDRVAVDPAALPLPASNNATQTFRSADGFVTFNGIRDAAPDGWGRYLMQKAAGAQQLDEFDYLVASGDERVGALAFGPDQNTGPKRITPWGDADLSGEQVTLERILDAVERIDLVDRVDPDLRRILEAGSSLGGARPKAATKINGEPWIAKFSAKDDTYPVCRTELAAMRLAKECRLNVPNINITTILGRDIFLIQRFDRLAQEKKQLRIPYASALTMLEAQDIASHRYSYSDLAEVIRKFGTKSRTDLLELFRRMVFNILVGNDDDHLRNHAFLFDGRGWRLSPLYDVVPKPHTGSIGSLVLAVGDRGHEATLANALTSAHAFGLRRDEAVAVIEELRVSVGSRWKTALRKAGIKEPDSDRLANCFAQSNLADWIGS